MSIKRLLSDSQKLRPKSGHHFCLPQSRALSLTLNRAYEIDPDDFYPWYYRAVISVRMKDFEKADSYLNEAESRADQFYQRSWVTRRRITVAKLIGDEAGIDRAYRKSIEVDPTNPYEYGNYAHYLLKKSATKMRLLIIKRRYRLHLIPWL